ncbi:MAG TPA: hypothetical protein VGD17_06995 [Chitinophagaceae bacterium]
MQVPLQYYFIALSALAGFLALMQKGINRSLWIFPFFLVFTLIIELIGLHMSNANIHNADLYNFFSLAAFTFYMYLLMQVVYSARARRIILYTMTAYVVISLVNILFIQKINTFHTLTYSIGCFLIVVISMYYFYELLQVPRSINLKREPAFWIVAGLLFFYICTLPILGVANYLFSFPSVIARSLEQIITILNILLYSLFTIAFLCRISFRRSML